MKREDVKNKKILSALLVGISTMMVMATPISAYAAEDGEPSGGEGGSGGNDTSSSSNESESSHVADGAISDSSDIREDISDAKTEEAKVDQSDLPATPGNAESGTPEGSAPTGPVEDANLNNANTNLENAETNLKEANKQNQEMEDQAVQAVSNFQGAMDAANNASKDAKDVTDVSDDLLKRIVSDDTNDAQAACDELTRLLNEKSGDVELKEKAFNTLYGKLEDAKAAFEAAESKLDGALNGAEGDINKAKEDLKKAKANVDTLSSTIDQLKAQVEPDNTKLQDFKQKVDNNDDNINPKNGKDSPSWNDQRNLTIAYLKDVYVPGLAAEGETISNINVRRVTGFERQDNNYYQVTYKRTYYDEQGAKKTENVTKYYNLDRKGRTYNDSNRWSGVDVAENDIQIFEKSEEEIAANNYLKSYFANDPLYVAKDGAMSGSGSDFNTVKDRTNAGEFDVFAYNKVKDDGTIERVMMVRKELTDALSEGTVTETDGKYYIGDIEIHRVIQNANSYAKSGNAENIIFDSENDKGAILQKASDTKEIFDKYAGYQTAIGTAKQKVSDAQTKTDTLSGTLNTLKTEKTNKVLPAKDVFGKDVATYLGLEDLLGADSVTPDMKEMLNNMTLKEVIGYVESMLNDAKGELNEAKETLQELEEKRDEAKEILDAKLALIKSDSSDDDDAGDGGSSSGTDASYNYAPTGAIESLVAQQGRDVLGVSRETEQVGRTTRTTKSADRQGVLGVRADTKNDDSASNSDKGVTSTGSDTSKNDTQSGDTAKAAGDKTGVTVADPSVPLADTPFEKNAGLNWLWLAGAGAAAGAGAFAYGKHRKSAQVSQEAKKYKK